MNILQVNNYGYVRGGSDKYFLDLSDLLAQHGHAVSYLVSDSSRNTLDPRWSIQGFDVAKPRIKDLSSFFYSSRAKREVRRRLVSSRIDVAHLHIYYGQITASILSAFREFEVPVVQTLHEYKLLCPISSMVLDGATCARCAEGDFWQAALHRCNRGSLSRSIAVAAESYISKFFGAESQVTHFAAVSDFVRARMIEYGISPERITTLYNFVSSDAFGSPDGVGDYFLFSGRLEGVKGVRTLLKAMERVPAARLVIAGEGSARREFEQFSAELELVNVQFVGFKGRAELRRLISGARCVVAPSECDETFGLALVESFALGRPVVASRRGGMQEVVDDGIDGLFFESGNVEELVERLKWMDENPAGALEMGLAGQKKARTLFSPERHLEGLMEIYRKAGVQ